MKRPFLATVGLLVALAPLACSDPAPFGPADELAVAGTYGAVAGASGSFGAVVFRADTADISRDLLAEGASIVLALAEDGTTAGRLFIPGDVVDVDEDLTGTWRLEGGRVLLDHAADTFLRDLPLQVDGDRLVGDARFGGVRVQVVLEAVSTAGFEGVADPATDFLVEATVDVMESFPVQLGGALTFTNPGPERRVLQTGACFPLLRAYGEDPEVPAWDQLEEGACAMLVPRVDVVEPGASIRFDTPNVSAAEILDDDLPDGTYRMTVYFLVDPAGEIELEAGTVELAVPR